MRDKLQELVKKYKPMQSMFKETLLIDASKVVAELESILATPDPAVTLKPGWIAKDSEALWWFRTKPTWGETIYGEGWSDPDFHAVFLDDSVADPWSDSHPNGGPECVMEVV